MSNLYREVYGLFIWFGFLSIATLLSNVRSSPQIHSAQKTPSGSIISIKAIIWGKSIGFLARILNVCFQNQRKSSRCHHEIGFRLENEECLFVGPNHSDQEHQEESVSFPVYESFHQSAHYVRVLPRQRIFGQQFSLASRQNGKRTQEKGDHRWFDPTQTTFLEHLSAERDAVFERETHSTRKKPFLHANRRALQNAHAP